MTGRPESGPVGVEDRIRHALAGVRREIEAACVRAGRDPSEVRLVGVTKTVPAEAALAAVAAGLSDLGENYAKELARKAPVVPARWHFLGRLQRGTAAAVAAHADVVHTAEPGGGLEAVARRAAAAGRTVPALVQVDFTGARQGSGPDAVESFVKEAVRLDGIQVVGLMTLPPPTAEAEGSRSIFRELRAIRDRLRNHWPDVVELSMGMSGDFPVAVEEGATMVRVGTALFGARPVTPGHPHHPGAAGGGTAAR